MGDRQFKVRHSRMAWLAALWIACHPLPVHPDVSDDAKAALDRGDDAAAVQIVQEPARRGDPKAQFALGYLYWMGRGVAVNHAEAFAWMRRAAEQGYARAEYNLGIFYRDGIGTRADDAAAFAWLEKSADHGFAPAQHGVAAAYILGRSVARSDAEAVRWYERAAAQGWVHSLIALGILTAQGRGTSKDPVRAYMLMILAEDGIDDASQRADLQNRRSDLATTMTKAQITEALDAARRWVPRGGESEPGYVNGPGSGLRAPKPEPGQPFDAPGQTFDVGPYAVTVPPGIPWKMTQYPGGAGATFIRTAGTRDSIAMIGVSRESLDDSTAKSTEDEAVRQLGANVESSFRRRSLHTVREVGRNTVPVGGKKVHRIVFDIDDRSVEPRMASTLSVYVYLPPDWQTARQAFVFYFRQEAERAQRDPLPAESVIASLRIK